MKITKEVLLALEACADTAGLIHEEVVVERAKDPESPLHSAFTWDDTEAGAAWRLNEARILIRRAKVRVLNAENDIVSIRRFASLGEDRKSDGGYRQTVKVLEHADHRRDLLLTMLAEAEALLKRNGVFEELSGVFAAIDAARKQAAA